jgi:hypothetical protein
MALQTTPNILGGGGWGAIRLLFPTINGSEVTDWDADTVDITGITAVKPEFANKRKATEYENTRTNKGVNVRVAKKDKTIDAVTGSEVAAEGQAPSIEFSYYANSTIQDKIRAALNSSDQPVIVIWGDGEVDGGLPKDYHLMGYIEGNIGEEYVEGVQTFTAKVVGGVGFTENDSAETGYIAGYKTTPGTITPDGYDDVTDAITLEDVTSGNVDTLLSGEIVEVTRA